MNVKGYSFVMVISLWLSACLPFVAAPSPDNPSTPSSQDAATTEVRSELLLWESRGSPCETAAITPQSLSYGDCGSTLTAVSAQTTGHSARLLELGDRYASFSARTRAGNLIFKGYGNLVPSDGETRAIAEWANVMSQVAQAGGADDSLSVAFAWHREGGPGGFCDEVVVYLTGWVSASDCRGYNAEGYLTASQLGQLYAWMDSLAAIDHTETFPPETGGLEMTLALNGNGRRQADEQTFRDIFEFAATLYTELGYAAEAGAEVEEARQVLQDYLIALYSMDYALAARLYGGDTGLLQIWNPDLGNDVSALLQRACTQNGLQCLVPRLITYRAPDADGGYHFYVEFNNADQTLFQQGPCCGEIGGAPVSMFPFLVEKSANGLLVVDLPPYVP